MTIKEQRETILAKLNEPERIKHTYELEQSDIKVAKMRTRLKVHFGDLKLEQSMDALGYMCEKHGEQLRKNGELYIVHPLSMACRQQAMGIINDDLYATNTTGSLIESVTNLRIRKCIAGSLGGVKQLEALIEQNQLDMVIYFKSTDFVDKNDPSVNNILSLCDQYNIPIATNLATAELLVKALDNGDLEWRSLYS